eukprot:scaffold501501_cov19-Prasinocladus_malaysianus.AAC.1
MRCGDHLVDGHHSGTSRVRDAVAQTCASGHKRLQNRVLRTADCGHLLPDSSGQFPRQNITSQFDHRREQPQLYPSLTDPFMFVAFSTARVYAVAKKRHHSYCIGAQVRL